MPRFELRLLGSPQVVKANGAPVDLPLGKPLAALCFLALETSAVRRSDLARMLWPSSTEPRARASIRQALWLIRKHTSPEVILEHDGALSVAPELLSTDLAALQADLSAGRLDEAMTRWASGPLRGFAIPDAPSWLAWADQLRARWESQLGGALEDRAHSSAGAERADWLEHALAVRPYRVAIHLELVRALVELRDTERAEEALATLRRVADPEDQEALRDAEECVRLLRRSTYFDPDERLVPEFVGRTGEYSLLMDAWRRVRSSRPSVVGLVGPRGIGKTALATEALRLVDIDHGQVVEARAVRTESSLEYGVVATLIGDLLRRPGAAGTSAASARILKALVPSEGADTSAVVPSPTALADALADLFDAVSDEAPLALLIDDAHWIDPASVPVILRAVRRLGSAPVLMLWTCRNDGPENACLQGLADAVSAGDATIIELGPLTLAEVREMVTLLVTGPGATELDTLGLRIHAASGGLPLHAVGLLQRLRDRGKLSPSPDGNWVLSDDALVEAFELPESLASALEDRVARLSSDAQHLGRLFAAAGAPTTLPRLQPRLALSEDQATAALSELLVRDLVRWTRDDRLELTHESLVEAFLPAQQVNASDPPRSHRTWWMMGAALLASILLGLTYLTRGPELEGIVEAPYGGGTLWLRGRGFATGYRFIATDRWITSDSLRIPPDLSVVPLATLPDGRVAMGGFTNSHPTDPPDAILVIDGQVDTVYSSSGEDVLRWLRPQGDAALLGVQHPDTANFRMMAVRLSMSSRSDTTILGSGLGNYRPSAWTPDGSGVLMVVDDAVDTLAMVDPAGGRLHSVVAPDATIVLSSMCGSTRVMGGSLPPGGYARYWLWTPGDTITRPWVPARPLSSPPTCSPDGSAVAYVSQVSDRSSLVVEELEGPVLFSTDLGDMGVTTVHWAAPARPVPVGVSIASEVSSLYRGERDTLRAEVVGSEGAPLDRPIRWRADDPGIASVDEFGVVSANRPGRTRVRAVVDGWLSDSLTIEVVEAVGRSTLAFSDSFPTLDVDTWVVGGEPVPEPVVTAEGHPALRLPGDGFYSDRIETRAEFDLSAGATLEARVRWDRFGRRDRQKFMMCLMRGEGRGPDVVSVQERPCLMWPSGEGTDFDADAVWFQQRGAPIGPIPLHGLARPGEWTTLAIQVLADGRVFAIVNDSIVAEHPRKLLHAPDKRFYISIYHAAVDTELLLRDVTLWTEERYR